MRIAFRTLAVAAAAVWTLGAVAQQTQAPLGNVVQFSASAVVEARQDELVVTLGTSREGSEPLEVQAQLKAALEASLAEARVSAQAGAMDVRSGNFSVLPRHGRDGRINGWQGRAEMMLAGRDFERIGSTAGRIRGMTVSGMVFGLSREQRERMEVQAQAQAIERFRARAGEITRAFGFASHVLREIAISSQEPGVPPRPRLMAMEARGSASDAPLPLEAGKASLQVTVSGSVQLK